MKYYKVVDSLNTPVIINTIQNNYGVTLCNCKSHQRLIEIVAKSSKKLNLPLDIYIMLNNLIANGGNEYLKTFPQPINGYYNVSHLTSNKKLIDLQMNENDLRKFISDIDDNEIYFFGDGNYLWEFIYEDVRKTNYHNLPARKDSLFLFENIKDCEYYISEHKGFGTICEVQIIKEKKMFRGDMNLLDIIPNHFTYNETFDHVNMYWSGKHSNQPIFEVLFQGECILKPL